MERWKDGGRRDAVGHLMSVLFPRPSAGITAGPSPLPPGWPPDTLSQPAGHKIRHICHIHLWSLSLRWPRPTVRGQYFHKVSCPPKKSRREKNIAVVKKNEEKKEIKLPAIEMVSWADNMTLIPQPTTFSHSTLPFYTNSDGWRTLCPPCAINRDPLSVAYESS